MARPGADQIRRSAGWRVTPLMACIVGMILGAGFAAPASAQGDAMFRLMTYNIRYANARDGADAWPTRKATVAKTLQEADVVGLQEVEVEQLRYLEQTLPEFTFLGVGRTDGKEAGEFSPLGIRKARFEIVDSGTFWLSESPEEVGSRGWDAALPRIATWAQLKDFQSGQSWVVINTHFDHLGAQARLESGRLIRHKLAEFPASLPAVVMGDLNALPNSPPLEALTAEGPRQLRDSRAITDTPPAGPSGTWNGFKEIAEGRRIDHVLVTSEVDVQSYEVRDPRTPAGRFASDHLPILVTLQPAAPK